MSWSMSNLGCCKLKATPRINQAHLLKLRDAAAQVIRTQLVALYDCKGINGGWNGDASTRKGNHSATFYLFIY
jgi:hypothetical protein